MLALVVSASLAGLPALRPLQPPLAVFTPQILQDASVNGAENGDRLLRYGGEACTGRAVSMHRAMGAALTMLERLQPWLAANPGAEAKLFKPGTVGEVMRHVSQGAPANVTACPAVSLEDEWRWPATALKACPSKLPESPVEQWLLVKKQPAAAIVVRPATDPCQPRLSIALFDPKGRHRADLHADFGGAMSAVLLGDRCQVAFSWDPSQEAFKAEWKSCKG